MVCASDIADAAYIASRAQTFEDCKALDKNHVWDDGRPREVEGEVLGEWLAGAMRRYDVKVPECLRLSGLASSDVNGSGGGKGVKTNRTCPKNTKDQV